MPAEQKPNWLSPTRRTLLTVGGSLVMLKALEIAAGPIRQLFPASTARDVTPLEAVPVIPPTYSVELPPGIKPLEKSQRQIAENALRRVKKDLENFFTDRIYTSEDKDRLERIHSLDDGAFTLWIRDVQKQNFTVATEKEFWNFEMGLHSKHQVQLEYEYSHRTEFDRKIHLQAQLAPGNESVDDLLLTSLKLPAEFVLQVTKSDDTLVAMGTSPSRVFRAYAKTSGLVGVILEGPVLTLPIIDNPTDIPEIIPEGLPGGFPRG